MNSTLNKLLDHKRTEDEDFYLILGCSASSTPEQINAEYKVRALKLHPDKNGGDIVAEKKFQLLQEAKETLTDPEKHKNYDKWRGSGIAISYRQWLGMREHVHTSMHWAIPKTKDRMLENDGNNSRDPLLESEKLSSDINWGNDAKAAWSRDTNSDIVNKFRNYKI